MSERRPNDSGAPPALRANLWAALALFTGSIEPIAAKVGFHADASPWQVQLARSTVAALVIVPITRQLGWLPRASVPRLVLAASLLFTTTTSMLFALSRLDVAEVIAILSITPATVAIASKWRDPRALGGRFALGVVLSIAGVVVTTGAYRGALDDALGIACVCGSVASSTMYRLTIEKLTATSPPALVSTWVYLVHGVIALSLLTPAVGMPPAAAWTAGLWTGIAAAISNVAFVAALAGLGAPRASVIMLLQRPIIVIAAALLLGEPLGPEECLASRWSWRASRSAHRALRSAGTPLDQATASPAARRRNAWAMRARAVTTSDGSWVASRSARSSSGSGVGGWPSPRSNDSHASAETDRARPSSGFAATAPAGHRRAAPRAALHRGVRALFGAAGSP
jgi:drug/metabolite transporter (DMT)-like permease